MNLPLIPQQHHGEAKNHPQNGAANIVHEDFFREEDEEEANRLENSLGFSDGTGSNPPWHQG